VIPLRILVVLGALSAFGPLSLDLYLPALPQLAADLRGTDAAAQLTMTACMVGLAVGQVVVGPVSDRYGRRWPLLIGVTVYALSSLLCALAPNMGVLIALRLVQGLAGAAGIVIARATVRDLYETGAAAHVFSLLLLVTGVAPVVAPIVGGQLLRITPWPGLFVALAGIGCVLLAGSAWVLRETLPPESRHSGGVRATGRQFASVLRDGRFLAFTAVLALGATVLFSYISMSPFVLQDDFGLSAQGFSYVFSANAVGLVLAGRISALLARGRGPTVALRTGLSVQLAASSALLVVVLLDAGLPVVLPILFLTVASYALVVPSATALGMEAHRSRAGTASGLMGLAMFGLSGALAPLVSLKGATPMLMASGMVVAGALALCIALSIPRRAPGREPDLTVDPVVPDPGAPGGTGDTRQ
jgi:DHA1 family bicyclomycin/chloramphenicol resistance-like MFS transporter